MASSKRKKESEDEQTITRKRKKIDRFVFLPDDTLLDILKRVPDAILRYKAKYVCRRWFSIITNTILLDHASFILQKIGTFTARHVDIREEEQQGLQVKEQYLEIPCIGRIRSWCNELLLIAGPIRKESLYVFNLITKEGSYLPQCNVSCGGHYARKCGVALSFDGFKGIYKVVHLFMGPPIQCEIVILRRDIVSRVSSKWKKMEVPCVNVGERYWGDPVSVQGRYFHWDFTCSDHLVSMDMVKEEILLIRLPGSGGRTRFVYSSFAMGGNLAQIEKVSLEKAEIWILKDFQRIKWEKLQSVTVQHWYFRTFPGTCVLYPVFGTISKRYISLEPADRHGMFSYDLENGVVKKLDIHIDHADDRCRVHSSAPSFI